MRSLRGTLALSLAFGTTACPLEPKPAPPDASVQGGAAADAPNTSADASGAPDASLEKCIFGKSRVGFCSL